MSERKGILERTKLFAVRIIQLYSSLPKSTEAQVLGKQLLRSGTSVGAQVREGNRSRSDAEMISKTERLTDLIKEADELTAILVASAKTLKARKRKTQ